jgi:hypothetical protein
METEEGINLQPMNQPQAAAAPASDWVAVAHNVPYVLY